VDRGWVRGTDGGGVPGMETQKIGPPCAD